MRRFLAVFVLVLALPALVQAASNPVVSASKRTAAAKTITFRMAATTTVAGSRATMTGSGVQRGGEARLSLRVRGQGAAAMRMDAVLLEEGGSYVMYMRSPLFASQLPRGKSWIRLDLSKQTASLGIDFSALVSTSQTFAPLEKGLVSTTRKGRAVVAGRPTMQYRAIIDVKRAARLVPAYGKQVAAIQRATGITLGRMSYDVWVAGDERIRRVRYTTPTVRNGKTVQTMTFLAFDEPVTIEAPPRSQVVTA